MSEDMREGIDGEGSVLNCQCGYDAAPDKKLKAVRSVDCFSQPVKNSEQCGNYHRIEPVQPDEFGKFGEAPHFGKITGEIAAFQKPEHMTYPEPFLLR